MVGASILRKLLHEGHPPERIAVRTHSELDLTNQVTTREFFEKLKPDQVYLAAAHVGGIFANDTFPADFISRNLMIAANVINAAFHTGVKKLLFLGSSCIYPRMAPQPIREEALLCGPLEPTNEPYAIAKIAGIKLCESYNRQYLKSHGIDYRSLMPTNLYGPGDNYHPDNSHVIPGLLQRFHQAKLRNEPTVSIWGSGTALREFLHVDDLADACVHTLNLSYKNFSAQTSPRTSHINAGSGEEVTIAELANLIKTTVGYSGTICFDNSKPDGTPRKLLDSQKILASGWKPTIGLKEGLHSTYRDYLAHHAEMK